MIFAIHRSADFAREFEMLLKYIAYAWRVKQFWFGNPSNHGPKLNDAVPGVLVPIAFWLKDFLLNRLVTQHRKVPLVQCPMSVVLSIGEQFVHIARCSVYVFDADRRIWEIRGKYDIPKGPIRIDNPERRGRVKGAGVICGK